MLCPYCKEPNTQVIDSRTCEEGSAIRRRRKCPTCGARFTTYEKAALQMPLISKKNGSVREAYNSEKLRRSMQIALRKRPVKASELDSAISRIEKQLQVSGEKEVTSKRVGDMVMLELKKRGHDVDTSVYTVAQAMDALRACKRKEAAHEC